MLEAHALGVHLFAVTGGEHPHRSLAAVRHLWDQCGRVLGMTDAVQRTGAGTEPERGWEAQLDHAGGGRAWRGLLAARKRPGPGVWQAALRRQHDTWCLSVMLAPAPADGMSWAELDARWSEAVEAAAAGRPEADLLGTARLYLARLAPEAGRAANGWPEPSGELAVAVRAQTPAACGVPPGSWPYRGGVVPQGFAVWEASAAVDTRTERRLVVIAAHDRDPELTAWTWTTRALDLPPLGRYLLHAAKLRHQVRVWTAAEDIGPLRARADAVITEVLECTAAARRGPGRQAELLNASRALVDLQARERGLVDRSTRSREMARTVEIASANLTALSGGADCGPFADDRALADWFAQRLDDEATYLEAALRRCEDVGAFTDQVVQRDLQRRQETVNLALTGVLGAILMSLAAVQSLPYTLPLPGAVKPAVVAALGALALLASFVVLRAVAPERRWSQALVGLGVAVLGGTLGWVAASASVPGGRAVGWTLVWAGAGAAAGVAAALAGPPWQRGARRRRQ
ncbi:CATRA conflict system CASPASE/TPR repeat-associated protein [Streptomyces sp. NPDC018019]|uniref:CATRA conflict system CASPASE/TPR repeat-associated protein n=1 Tax=Streptomyces sp. NPDC018019 TaxID=3365030 RepID=UPI00379E682A